MCDIIADIEDPDLQIEVESQYLALLDDLPLSDLLDRLEKLHRFVLPDDDTERDDRMQAPHEDARCRAPIEPMENLYDSLADGLQYILLWALPSLHGLSSRQCQFADGVTGPASSTSCTSSPDGDVRTIVTTG